MTPDFSAGSSAKILHILYDFQLACCVNVAANLGIAELLFEGPQTVSALALATSSDPDALRRVLKVLAAERIFKETQDDLFVYTTEAAALHGDTEGSIKHYLLAIMGEHYPAFGNLLHSVRTGQTAFDHHYKMDVWEYYSQHPSTAANFNKAMAGLTQYYVREIIPAYNFGAFRSVIDIGGGNGALLFSILKANPHLKGVIFDAPHVVSATDHLIRSAGLEERCVTAAGDFFEEIPSGIDCYLLKYILHDWSDIQCAQILRNCASAMYPGARLLIFEAVIPSGNAYHEGKYTDVTMLVATKGRERTEEEFHGLLSAAGLEYVRTIPLSLNEISIVEAVKPAGG